MQLTGCMFDYMQPYGCMSRLSAETAAADGEHARIDRAMRLTWGLLEVVALGMLAACGSVPSDSAASGPWKPEVSDTWQWQLAGPINRSYDVAVYEIDLFETPADTIDALRAQGRRVVCYFSAGSSEDWRPDFDRFADSDMGLSLADWPGERWLDTRSPNVRQIISDRLDLARSKGCDGVEPDNVDGYQHDSGFDLDAPSQLDFNRFLAAESHKRGLVVGLKNNVDQISELLPDFDFAVNERCFEYDECDSYAEFIATGKPVFNAEYADRFRLNENGARDTLCQSARAANIRTLVLPLELDDSLRFSCD
jgi:hypothetical protein